VATAATKLMTASDFWDFASRPENAGKFLELEQGEVVEMPSPGKLHGFVCGNIGRILGNYAATRRVGYVCSNDSGLFVESNPDTIRGPDLSFYIDDHTAETMEKRFSKSPPQLVVEVRSPHDRERRVMRRLEQYLRFGVPMVWLVDPEDRFVSVHQPSQIPRVLEESDDLIADDVLPDFRCRVADFFALPGQ